jgi:hypothetical protein
METLTKQKQQKFFPSQEKEEKIILLLRKHWFNYAIFFFLDLLIAIPVLTFAVYWAKNPDFANSTIGDALFMSLSIFVLFMLAAQLYGFVDYYLDVYIVTNQRIVDISQGGFFKRQISELHLHQVQDVNASVDSFWGTLLHFGDVHIQTAGERENFVFKSIPHPYGVAKKIIDLHETHIEELSKTKKSRTKPDQIETDEALPYGKTGITVENFKKEPPSKTVSSIKENAGQEIGSKSANKNQGESSLLKGGQMEEGREISLKS